MHGNFNMHRVAPSQGGSRALLFQTLGSPPGPPLSLHHRRTKHVRPMVVARAFLVTSVDLKAMDPGGWSGTDHDVSGDDDDVMDGHRGEQAPDVEEE